MTENPRRSSRRIAAYGGDCLQNTVQVATDKNSYPSINGKEADTTHVFLQNSSHQPGTSKRNRKMPLADDSNKEVVEPPYNNATGTRRKRERKERKSSKKLILSGNNLETPKSGSPDNTLAVHCETTISEDLDYSPSQRRLASNSDLTQEPNPRYWPTVHNDSSNVFHYVSNAALGRLSKHNVKAMEVSLIQSHFSDLEIIGGDEPFKTRITTIEWHPRQKNLFTVGGKHGDIVFYKMRQLEDFPCGEANRILGTGPGGSISALKYHPVQDEKFYTSSLCGKVCEWNAETGELENILLNTMTWDNWFSSMDVHQREGMLVAGRSNGWAYLLSQSGEQIWEKRLHKRKVNHTEFSPIQPSLLVTASLDHTVCLWDIRMLKVNSPLECLRHEKGVNSAYFSLTDGCRLLTTDQFDEIRVYQAPFWHEQTRIRHPHRFFQHLTPIKASWHPVRDYIICGRYPDMNAYPEEGPHRVVDIFDADSGKRIWELQDKIYNNIVSLSKFDGTGDTLVTSMGFNICLWAKRGPSVADIIHDKVRDGDAVTDLSQKPSRIRESTNDKRKLHSQVTNMAGHNPKKKGNT